MTSKSTGLSVCSSFKLKLKLPASVFLYCRADSGPGLGAAEADDPHQMFHITQCENPSYSSGSLLQVRTHPWKRDISYFILVCGCRCKRTPVHMQPVRPPPLISPTAANCGRRTNERNIGRFHGNCHSGPTPLLAARAASERWEVQPVSSYTKIILKKHGSNKLPSVLLGRARGFQGLRFSSSH